MVASEDDLALMEASLLALADTGIDLRRSLFERFFAAVPERRPVFYNPDVSSIRMTDETLQMMFGLAKGERWVEPLVAELMFTHRNYGPLPIEEYRTFLTLTVDCLRDAVGEDWTEECDRAWRTQADALFTLIDRMKHDWAAIMPGAPV